MDLERLWKEFTEKAAAGGDARELYREMVWPAVREEWEKEPKVVPAFSQYDVSIHNLGTSPEAAILAILGTRAEEVYLLYTKETEKFIERVREETGANIHPLPLQGGADVQGIYLHVRDIIERGQGDERVALDITGGTKAMGAALAAAGFHFKGEGAVEDLGVVYIESDFDAKLRLPRAGSEKLITLPSPEVVYSLERESETKSRDLGLGMSL